MPYSPRDVNLASVPRSERTAARQADLRKGLALPPASKGGPPGFPIPDAAHWDKARRAVGRVQDPARREALARLLRKTAPQFGKEKELDASWAAPGGSMHANDTRGIGLAMRARDMQGEMLTCPECNYSAPAGHFGASGTPVQAKPALLRTPAPGTGMVRRGAAVTVRGGGHVAGALANPPGGITLAAGTLTRRPISGPQDVLVARGEDGTAVLRHRHGGAQIASLRKTGDGRWIANVNGTDLQPRDMQRTALMEAVGTWNRAIGGAVRAQEAPLRPEPEQTSLMAEYGIPAMRAATFATPVTSSYGGARVTAMGGRGAASRFDPDKDGDDDASPSGDTDRDYAGGLGPKGRAAYQKLRRRGMPAPRALALAKRVDSMAGQPA